MTGEGPRMYRGVVIFGRNYCGMYSARVPDGARGGIRVAADTLAGMREIIRETLARTGRARAED